MRHIPHAALAQVQAHGKLVAYVACAVLYRSSAILAVRRRKLENKFSEKDCGQLDLTRQDWILRL